MNTVTANFNTTVRQKTEMSVTKRFIEKKGSGYRNTHGSSYSKTYSTISPCM